MERRELYRLSTFSSWPEYINLSPLMLARCGFFYAGMGNAVTCEGCNTVLDHLEQPCDVLERHREQSPHCPFVLPESASRTPCRPPELALAVGGLLETDDCVPEIVLNDRTAVHTSIYSSAPSWATIRGAFPTNVGSSTEPSGSGSSPGLHADPQGSTQGDARYRREQPDYERLQNEGARLLTFSQWPVNACVDLHDLAQGGFFYTGQADRVQCAFCRGYLEKWKARDDVQTEHRKYSPNCPFLRCMAASGRHPQRQMLLPSSPESAQNQIQSTGDQISAVMDREEIRVLLPIIQNRGFSENDLRTVVAERLSRGDDCLSPTKLLGALFTRVAGSNLPQATS